MKVTRAPRTDSTQTAIFIDHRPWNSGLRLATNAAAASL